MSISLLLCWYTPLKVPLGVRITLNLWVKIELPDKWLPEWAYIWVFMRIFEQPKNPPVKEGFAGGSGRN